MRPAAPSITRTRVRRAHSAGVFDGIETWYNRRRRRHSSLDDLSPLEFESQHHDGHTITNP